MAARRRRETDIARPVLAWFQDAGWDTHEEVCTGLQEPIADIVATRNGLYWIVEVKTRRSLDLVEQARDWLRFAHMVSVAYPAHATPRRHRRVPRPLWEDILRWQGIGGFLVMETVARNAVAPRLCRKPLRVEDYIGRWVNEHNRSGGGFAEAGSVAGDRASPFRVTERLIIELVRNSPGIRLSEIPKRIEHHYASDASAVSCIRRWIQEGVMRGLRVERGRVFPDDTTHEGM